MEIVECRSDQEYAGRPVALYWQGKHLLVAGLLQEWRTPEGKRFLVRTEDGAVFELNYHEVEDSWRIEPAG